MAAPPTPALVIVVGVDGVKRGWLAVALENGSVCVVEVRPTFEDVLARFADAAVFGVDTPSGSRRRQRILARPTSRRGTSSAFAATPSSSHPFRESLLTPSFADACAVGFSATGKRPSRQAFGLRTKILELDGLSPGDERIREVHPEVSFRELAGTALPFPKQSWNGFHLRRELLDREGIALPTRVDDVAPALDVLDAAAAAWSAARIAAGSGQPLPDGHAGRLGAIWR